jgi:transcriptional regulator with XRE-family HTH domain
VNVNEAYKMFINKTNDGLNNLCGKKVALYRKELKISQRELADKLQIIGLDIDKNAIQRIECGKRFVTDIELKSLSIALNKQIDELF